MWSFPRGVWCGDFRDSEAGGLEYRTLTRSRSLELLVVRDGDFLMILHAVPVPFFKLDSLTFSVVPLDPPRPLDTLDPLETSTTGIPSDVILTLGRSAAASGFDVLTNREFFSFVAAS